MKNIYLSILMLILTSCAGTFTSTIAPGYQLPEGEEIALTYLNHPDITISFIATAVLTQQLMACGIFNFIAANKTNEIFQKNNINMPRHLTQNFIIALKELIPTKYLITGGISIWKKGSVGFPVASPTEVSASLTMYDLETGKVVWRVFGQEEGGRGIFAEAPVEKAKIVFSKMIKKWPGLCRTPGYAE